MLKVKVDRETMVKAIEWHARDKEGLTPVIADDGDLCDWARWVLATLSNYGAEQLDGAGLLVTAEIADVVIAIKGDKVGYDVLDAVSTHVL